MDNIVYNFLKQLLNKGFYSGNLDGIWGKFTQKAWENAKNNGYVNRRGQLIKLNTSNPNSPNSELYKQQEWLFNHGMFDNANRKQAVDGLPGNRTTAAFNKARQLGYTYSGNGNFSKKEGRSWQPTLRGCRRVYNPVTKKYTTECAEYANLELLSFKNGTYYKGASGDAWTRVMNGDNILSGYDDLPDFKTTWNPFDNETKRRYQYSLLAADAFKKKFNINSLKPGEVYMANMYFLGSPNVEKAFANGTGIKGKHKATRGTHTGNIYYDYNSKLWRISHNIHGREYNEPLSLVLGGNHKYGITAISRVRHLLKGGNMERVQFWDQTGTSDMSNIGILPKVEGEEGRLKLYSNADSPEIAGALQSVYDHRNELMKYYNLTPQEYTSILGDTHGVLYNESNGGGPTRLTTKGFRDNTRYRKTHLNPIGNFFRHFTNALRDRDTSEGLGSVKDSSFGNNLVPVNYKQYPKNSSEYGGLSTYLLLAMNWNSLKKMFRPEDRKLLYNADGSISDLGNALLLLSHNLGMTKEQNPNYSIENNYEKYLQDGDITHLTNLLKASYAQSANLIVRGHEYSSMPVVQLPTVEVVAPRKPKKFQW